MLSYKIIPGFNSQTSKFSSMFSKPAGCTAHWTPTVLENRSRASNFYKDIFCHWISFWNLNSEGLHKRGRVHPLSKFLWGCYDSGFMPGEKHESQNPWISGKGHIRITEPNSLLLTGPLKTQSYDWEKAEVWEKQSHGWACSPTGDAEILLGKARLCPSPEIPHYSYSNPMYSHLLDSHKPLPISSSLKYYYLWGEIALLPTKLRTIHLLEGSWRRILLFLHSLPF